MERPVAAAVRTSNLRRSFGSVIAVNGLDLVVPTGAIYALLGPNGAGKTTTMRLLLGLIAPDAGDVELLGMSVRSCRASALAQVGALVETPSLYPHLTGRENLGVTAWLTGTTRRQVDAALSLVGLEAEADGLVGGYSLGMRQRLGLALALMRDAPLLILDEPMNGLDPAGMREIRELIRWLPSSRGATVLVSSHLLGEVDQIATHVGILNRGYMVYQGSLESLRAQRVPTISLEVSDPERAEAVLAKSGWSVSRRDSLLRLSGPVVEKAQVACVNAVLVNAGVDVYELALQCPSLEETFLALTTTVAASVRQ